MLWGTHTGNFIHDFAAECELNAKISNNRCFFIRSTRGSLSSPKHSINTASIQLILHKKLAIFTYFWVELNRLFKFRCVYRDNSMLTGLWEKYHSYWET